MLKEEESKINRLITNEGRALEQCINKIKALDTKKQMAEKKFVEEMDPMNTELATILQRRLEKKTEGVLTDQSVNTNLLPYMDMKSRVPHIAKSKEDVEGSVKKLLQATKDRDDAMAQLVQVKKSLHQKGIDVDALMTKGHEQLSTSEGTPNNNGGDPTKHMNMFYGPGSEEGPATTAVEGGTGTRSF
jgi:hypothetical protein